MMNITIAKVSDCAFTPTPDISFGKDMSFRCEEKSWTG